MALGTTAAILAGAAIGAGTSLYVAGQQADAAEDQFRYATQQQSAAAIAEAQAMKRSAAAEASSIRGQAESQAKAFRSQAEIERNLLYKQAEEARTVAYANIDKMKEEATESLRRLEGEQSTWEAKARAKAAASGVRREGSTALYLNEMESENDRQYGWLDKSYQSGLDVARKTAGAEYSITRAQGDAAVKAGGIQARAALEAGGYQANMISQAGHYGAQALHKKAYSLLGGK